MTKIGGMPRRARVLIEGGVYHVYYRVASDEPVFADLEEAIRFIDLIRSLAALSKPNGEMRCQTKHHGSHAGPMSLSWTVFHNFDVSINLIDNYDSRPPTPDALKNDASLNMSVGYSY